MVSYIENPGRYSTYALSCIVMAQEGSPKSTMIGQKAITSAADVELADSCVEVGTAEQSTMSDEWQCFFSGEAPEQSWARSGRGERWVDGVRLQGLSPAAVYHQAPALSPLVRWRKVRFYESKMLYAAGISTDSDSRVRVWH